MLFMELKRWWSLFQWHWEDKCPRSAGSVAWSNNDLAAVLSKLRTVPIQGNAGMMQQPQQHMVHQQQQDMISLLQHSEAASSLAPTASCGQFSMHSSTIWLTASSEPTTDSRISTITADQCNGGKWKSRAELPDACVRLWVVTKCRWLSSRNATTRVNN